MQLNVMIVFYFPKANSGNVSFNLIGNIAYFDGVTIQAYICVQKV